MAQEEVVGSSPVGHPPFCRINADYSGSEKLLVLQPYCKLNLYFRQRPVREPRGGISDRPEVRQAMTFRVRLPRRGLVLSSLIVWLPH